MLTRLLHIISADLSAAQPSCQSPAQPRPEGVLLDSDLVAGQVTSVHLLHNPFEGTLSHLPGSTVAV